MRYKMRYKMRQNAARCGTRCSMMRRSQEIRRRSEEILFDTWQRSRRRPIISFKSGEGGDQRGGDDSREKMRKKKTKRWSGDLRVERKVVKRDVVRSIEKKTSSERGKER